MRTFVQIGTNDGDDRFRKIIIRQHGQKNSKIILVEPNASLNQLIRQNYREFPQAHIENVAITTHSGDVTKLYINKKFYNPLEQLKLKNTRHLAQLLEGEKEEDQSFCIDAPTLTFMDLCKKYDLKHIDFLMIDTEGYDGEIIKSIDFDAIRIDSLTYEHWFSPQSDGLQQYVESKGYRVERDPHEPLNKIAWKL